MSTSNIARFCLVGGIVNSGERLMGQKIANALNQDIEIVNAFGIKGYSPKNDLLVTRAFDFGQEQQKTFYCLFMPLGIYCAFGASNIHHAYNKAAKHWGAKPKTCVDLNPSVIQRDYRISVSDLEYRGLKEVKQTTMTKLVKAWREDN